MEWAPYLQKRLSKFLTFKWHTKTCMAVLIFLTFYSQLTVLLISFFYFYFLSPLSHFLSLVSPFPHSVKVTFFFFFDRSVLFLCSFFSRAWRTVFPNTLVFMFKVLLVLGETTTLCFALKWFGLLIGLTFL